MDGLLNDVEFWSCQCEDSASPSHPPTGATAVVKSPAKIRHGAEWTRVKSPCEDIYTQELSRLEVTTTALGGDPAAPAGGVLTNCQR